MLSGQGRSRPSRHLTPIQIDVADALARDPAAQLADPVSQVRREPFMRLDQDLSNQMMDTGIEHGFDAFGFGPFYVHLDDGDRLMETLQELHQVNHLDFKAFAVRVFVCLDQGRRFGPAEIADVRPLMECSLSR